MDAVRVALLREVLAGTRWPSEARGFAGALRSCVVPQGGGLLLVGTRAYEPWHLAAHLVDEAAWSGQSELAPTLVRHEVPYGAPAHLTVGLGRLEGAGRGETLLVVAPGAADDGLLERVHGARRAGATVFSLDGGDPEMHALAHEVLTVACTAGPPRLPAQPRAAAGPGRPADPPAGTGEASGTEASGGAGERGGAGAPVDVGFDVDFDTVQHLVSAAAGESALPAARGRRRFRDRLSLLADHLTAPPPARW
ncbi:hypothetical protein [Streptomyces montanisoli]|uniref:SIS domain-containing protein n=1 Tax=Streptomyces montanisoli TaxID=2798581 RepID=A0A940RTR8_9ACTN|nr:hypothetical protein [Streptomyces montanisoli]MBP0457177.1 hypothetical protein [Streptomyces montanisoli]